MRGRGIALGRVPKNPGKDQWMPDPDPVDPELYDFSQYYDQLGNGSMYDDWFSDYDPCNGILPEPMYVEEEVSLALRMYAPPLLISFGVVGNVLSAYIMSEFSDRFLSSCLYFTLLSITETIVLVLRSGNDWLRTFHKIDFTNFVLLRSNASCEVYSFFTSFMYHFCSWLVVVPVAEMAIMARDFSKAHKISTTSRIKNTVLLMVFFVIFVNAHFFFTFELLDPDWDPMCARQQCTFRPGIWGEMFRDWLWPLLGDNIIANLGPILSVFLCLCYILIKHCANNSPVSAKNKIMQNRFLMDNEAVCDYILICVVTAVFFLCTTIPEACYNLYEFILEKAGVNESSGDTVHWYAQRELAGTVGSFLRDVFLSTKVIIYAACWKHFRVRLLSMVSVFHILAERKKKQKLREENFLAHRDIENQAAVDYEQEEVLSPLAHTGDVTSRFEHRV